jgi:hypothetical protein
MTRIQMILSGALASAFFAIPVLAGSSADCLWHSRMWSSRVLDARTILFTDVRHNKFVAHVRGACQGLTSGAAILVFHTWMNLGCVGDGDLVGVQSPGFGVSNCRIADIHAAAPETAQG